MIERNKKHGAFWLPLMVVCLAQIGTTGDNTVVSFATRQFIENLHASMDQVQLVNTVYSLLAGALMVFGGMLGIAKGFKNVFLIGALFCTIGELIAVITPNMSVLIWGARIITGFGGALMIPSVLGIIVSLYQGVDRMLAFGAVGSATGIANIAVPIISGLIMDNLGYKFAFSIMAMWFVILLIGAYFLIPSIKSNLIRMDYSGTVLTFIGLILFIIGFSKISVWGLITPLHAPFTVLGIAPTLPMIVLGVLIMVLTLVWERRVEKIHGAALIPQSFIGTRQVRNGLYVTGLVFTILGSVNIFMVPTWVMVVSGQSSTQSALVLMFIAVPMIVLSILIPKKFSYLSPRAVVMVSSLLLLLGCLVMAFSLEPGDYSRLMYVGLFLCGLGAGGYFSQATMIVTSALNPRDAAQSSGVVCSSRNVWEAAAIAIIGSVFLFGMTTIFKHEVAHSSLSPAIKEHIANKPVIYVVSMKAMQAELSVTDATSRDVKQSLALLAIYQRAQVSAGRYAFFALFIIVLLHIPGFIGIQTKGWSEREKR